MRTASALLAIVCAFCCYGSTLAAVAPHEVTNLPGWAKPLPSKQYSGYITIGPAGQRKALHYWLTLSQGNPDTDPLILWLNGGPGTSSLFGMFTELGQLVTNYDSFDQAGADGVPALQYNPYSWNQVASTVFLESPAGVGFSYCKAGNCTNTDESTADDTHEFLQAFAVLYPEFKTNEFYIVGESYAGVYIPMLAQRLLNSPVGLNFQGIAIGNGCVGKDVGICAETTEASFKYALEFFRTHFMVSPPLYAALTAACDWSAPPTPQCFALIKQLRDEMGHFNLYNVYDTCGDPEVMSSQSESAALLVAPPSRAPRDLFSHWHISPTSGTMRMRHLGPGTPAEHQQDASTTTTDAERGLAPGPLGAQQDAASEKLPGPHGRRLSQQQRRPHWTYPQQEEHKMDTYRCGGEVAMAQYLSYPQVAKALHVLSKTPGMTYVRTVGDLRPLMAWLVERLRVLIYSGDVDACVPTNDTEDWIQWVVQKYGLKPQVSWRPWRAPTSGGAYIKAGYYSVYGPQNFTFVTFNGAGHMVPTYKPAEALAMITRFLKRQDLDQPPPQKLRWHAAHRGAHAGDVGLKRFGSVS